MCTRRKQFESALRKLRKDGGAGSSPDKGLLGDIAAWASPDRAKGAAAMSPGGDASGAAEVMMLRRSPIPQLLRSMLELVGDELDAGGSAAADTEAGTGGELHEDSGVDTDSAAATSKSEAPSSAGAETSVVECMLSSGNFATLCEYAVDDSPSGITALVLHEIGRTVVGDPGSRGSVRTADKPSRALAETGTDEKDAVDDVAHDDASGSKRSAPRGALLHDRRVHEPLRRLVSACALDMPKTRSSSHRTVESPSAARAASGAGGDAATKSTARAQRMLVELVQRVWLAVQEDPSLLQHFHQLPGTRRSRRRRPSAAASSGPTTPPARASFDGEDAAGDTSGAGVDRPAVAALRRPGGDFGILQAVLPHLNARGQTGESARQVVLLALSIGNPAVHNFVSRHTSVASAAAEDLANAFLELEPPAEDATVGSTAQSRGAASFVAHLRFCNALSVMAGPRTDARELRRQQSSGSIDDGSSVGSAGGTSSNRVQDSIVSAVNHNFFSAVLRPALFHHSEARVRCATVYTTLMVRELGRDPTSPLLSLLLARLLGEHSAGLPPSPSRSVRSSNPLHAVLVERLDELSEPLAVATLDLFAELLALNDQRVFQHLCSIPPAAAAGEGAGGEGGEGDEDGAAPPAGLTERSVGVSATPPRLGRTTATTPVVASPALATEGLKVASSDAFVSLFPGSPAPTIGDDGSVDASFGAYYVDAERQLTASAPAYALWGDEERGDGATSPPPTGQDGHRFLQIVLNKVSTMLRQSIAMNVALTGVLSALTRCPRQGVHAYLFGEPSGEARDADRGALLKVLEAVWRDAQRRASRIPMFAECLANTRARLGVDAPGAGPQVPVRPEVLKKHQRLLEAYVVVEELLKELTCILQAKRALVAFPAGGGDSDDEDAYATGARASSDED